MEYIATFDDTLELSLIYEDENILEMTLEETVNPGDDFELGAAPSSLLEVSLIDADEGIIFEQEVIKPYVGLVLENTIEYVPLGVFVVDDIKKEKRTIKLVCFDNMIKLEKPYFSELTYPAPISAVAQEICTKAGVTLATTLPDVQIGDLSGYTLREAIGFIAAFMGGFARFNRDGQLEITSYADSGVTITADNYASLDTAERAYSIGRLTCYAGEDANGNPIVLTAGATGHEVIFECPIMTQEQLDSIYSSLSQISYMPFNMEWQGNPALVAGDKITIIDAKGNVYSTLLMRQKITYKGSVKATAEAVGKTEQAQEFRTTGTLTKKMERYVAEQALIKQILADKASIGELEAVEAKIDNLVVDTARIQDLAVTTAKIADAAVTNAKIANAAIDSAKIQDASITTAKIQDGAITNAKIGTAAIDTANIKDGAITSAKIGNAQIKTAHIEDLAVTTTKIADAAITAAKIGNAQITGAKIANATIETANIKDGAITNAKIANGTIDNAKIADASISTAKIQTGAITTALIAQGAVGTAQIADGSITDAKIVSLNASKINAGTINTGQVTIQGANGKLKISNNRLQVFDNQPTPVERVSIGDVNNDGTVYGIRVRGADGQTVLYDHNGVYTEGITDGAITNPKIADDAVDSRVIAANSILAEHIVAGAITGDKIAARTITANNIATNTITAASGVIADAAITTAKIADGAVTNAKIADATITGAKIANATIDTANIKDGAITTAKIGDLQVTNAKIANGAVDNAKIANLDASKITSGYISAARIAAGSITGDKIAASTITADKLNVSSLSAISANLGTVTAGTLQGVNVIGGTIKTAETGTRLELTGNVLRGYSNSTLKVQLTGEFMEFWDAGNTIGRIRAWTDTVNQRGILEINTVLGEDININTTFNDFQKASITLVGTKYTDGQSGIPMSYPYIVLESFNNDPYLGLVGNSQFFIEPGRIRYTGDNASFWCNFQIDGALDVAGDVYVNGVVSVDNIKGYTNSEVIKLGTTGPSVDTSGGSARWKRSNLDYISQSDTSFNVYFGGSVRFRVTSSGNADVFGNTICLRNARTPASATATGNAGDICWDSNYIYVCVATNRWKRVALSSW